MINTKLQNIIDTKAAIGNAINNKGGTITANTPFYNYAAQIDNISTGSVLTGNATTGDVLSGFTFYNNDANTQLTGTLALTGNATTGQVFSGQTFYATDAKTKLTGTFDFTGNATTADVASGQTFYASNSSKLTGTGALVGATGYDFDLVNKIENATSSWANAIAINGGNLYIGGTVNDTRLRVYDKNNLALIANTGATTGGITAIATSPNLSFLYYASNGGNSNITKLITTNLSSYGSSNSYVGLIHTISVLDDQVVAGGNTGAIKVWWNTFLDYRGATNSYGGAIYSIITDPNYIYVGGAGGIIKRWFMSNLNYNTASTTSYGGEIRSIVADKDFLYVGGFTARDIKKYHKSNLVYVGNTSLVPSDMDIRSVIVDDYYIYASGYIGRVHTFYKSNLATISNSASYGLTTEAIAKDIDKIYMVGRLNNNGAAIIKDGKAYATVSGVKYYKIP